jgi:hypothetical protein
MGKGRRSGKKGGGPKKPRPPLAIDTFAYSILEYIHQTDRAHVIEDICKNIPNPMIRKINITARRTQILFDAMCTAKKVTSTGARRTKDTHEDDHAKQQDLFTTVFPFGCKDEDDEHNICRGLYLAFVQCNKDITIVHPQRSKKEHRTAVSDEQDAAKYKDAIVYRVNNAKSGHTEEGPCTYFLTAWVNATSELYKHCARAFQKTRGTDQTTIDKVKSAILVAKYCHTECLFQHNKVSDSLFTHALKNASPAAITTLLIKKQATPHTVIDNTKTDLERYRPSKTENVKVAIQGFRDMFDANETYITTNKLHAARVARLLIAIINTTKNKDIKNACFQMFHDYPDLASPVADVVSMGTEENQTRLIIPKVHYTPHYSDLVCPRRLDVVVELENSCIGTPPLFHRTYAYPNPRRRRRRHRQKPPTEP